MSILTPESLRAAYDFLCATPPFSKWNLPDGEEVIFRVCRAPKVCGWYGIIKEKHVIAISRRCISHTSNLMATMAHEMIHLHQREAKIETPGAEHNRAFLKLAERVCRIHGWDSKLF